MKTTGTKTMQMQSVETNAGVAICEAPSMIAWYSGFLMWMFRCTFSISTVASSTRIPTARAIPPSVITFSVCPSAASARTETRIESGIEMQMMIVLRQEPRNNRIIRPVKPAAIAASLITPEIAARTKIDWSPTSSAFSSFGSVCKSFGRNLRTLSTISMVDAPLFRIGCNTPRVPSTLTIFCCGMLPSRTCATSRM